MEVLLGDHCTPEPLARHPALFWIFFEFLRELTGSKKLKENPEFAQYRVWRGSP
jgi:hypothetical protein